MRINQVNTTNRADKVEQKPTINRKKLEDDSKKLKDEYIAGTSEKKNTYDKSSFKADGKTIQQLKEESDRVYNNLKQLVQQLLESQGMSYKDASQIKVTDGMRADAQASIADGGEFSPEMVSDRILKFAKAISGGDKSKIELLRKAIDKGFREASDILGGLPDISKKTYDLVMQKLDAWMKE